MASAKKSPRLSHLATGEVISGILIGALGVFVVSQASGWDFLGPAGPGPGFFPMCYGVAMIVMSLAFVVHRVTTRPTGEPANPAGVAVALATWAGFVVSIPVMTYLGFLVALALLVLFMVIVVFGRPILHGLVAAVLCPAAFQLVFPTLLHVRLPVGRITGF